MELKAGMRSVSRMFVTETESAEIQKGLPSRSKHTFSQFTNELDYDSSFSDLFVPEKVTISPANFEQFMPWIGKAMCVEAAVHVIKLFQDDYVGVSDSKKRLRSRRNLQNVPSDFTRVKSSIIRFDETAEGDTINVLAYYNTRDRLVAIHIDNCENVTQRFLKVLSLAIPYHPMLRKLKMIRGHLKKYVLYEMSKLISASLITELCLDDTFAAEDNYFVLLEGGGRINRLSLNRCNITDKGLELLAQRLENNDGPVKSLYSLDLASNRITDSGALMIAKVLRKNRKILHLNLADNHITDVGAEHILNTLKEFRLTDLEVKETVVKNFEYYRKKQEIFERVLAEQKKRREAPLAVVPNPLAGLSVAAGTRRKEPMSLKARRQSRVSMVPITKSPPTVEETATLITNQMTGGGKLRHEFDSNNTVRRDNEVYCRGNFRLCSLNLAYNNLQLYNVKTIKEVLEYQNTREDKSEKFPGLLRIVIEGNNLPRSSNLYETVAELLNRALYYRMPLRVLLSAPSPHQSSTTFFK